METILSSLKARVPRDSLADFSLPYFGSLKKLVHFEPNDPLPSDQPNSSSRRVNFDDKLLTHLSSNPSQYEIDLRTLVLDLYSDHRPGDKGHGDLIGMNSDEETLLKPAIGPFYEDVFNRSETLSTPMPSSSGSSLQDTVLKEPPILLKYQETALIDNLADTTQSRLAKSQEQAPSLHVNQTTGDYDRRYTQTHLKSFQELQQNLQNFDLTDAPELLRDRHGSCESRSFSDSGIHLEFLSSDVETIDSDTKGNRDGKYSDDCNDCDDRYDGKERKMRLSENSAIKVTKYERVKEEVLEEAPENNTEDLRKRRDYYEVETLDQKSCGQILPDLVSVDSSVLSSTPIKMLRGQISQDNDALVRVTSYNGTIDDISREQNLQLRLELANMEGRLESLTTEYRGVLEEKHELYVRITAMEDKVEKDGDHDDVHSSEEKIEFEELLAKENRLKKKIVELQQDIDTKDQHVNEAEQRLRVSKKDVEKLQKTLQILEAELTSKTSDVELFQHELGNARKTIKEAQVLHEGQLEENEVLHSDVSTLVKAKTWLLKQLEMAKDTHVKLELELSDCKSTVFSQNKHVEQLKLKNARTNIKLSETQDKVVAEKARILEHLEKVEEDLLNQDSAFRKMQAEKETVQRELAAKIESLQNENTLLLNLTEAAKKFQDELEISRNEANTKSSLLRKLREEKDEVDQHLKVARSINEVSEKKIEALYHKLEKNENQLEMALSEEEARKVYVQELENKNAVLEESIKEAQEEKEALDSAVQLLRVELNKVERRFKLMKRELTSKTNRFEEVTTQKDGFVDELRVLRDEMEKHVLLLETLRDTIRIRDEAITALHNDKVKMLVEVRGLRVRLENAQTSFEKTYKEKEDFFEQLQTSKSQVSHLEKTLHESSSEKAKLEGQLESTRRAAMDQEICLKSLKQCLKQEVNEIQKNLRNEVTRHRDETINLGQEVEYFKGQLQERHKEHKNEVLELKEKLLHLEVSKTQIEANTRKKVKELCDSSVSEVKENYEKKLHVKELDLDSTRQAKEDLFFKYTELEEKAKNTADLQKDRIAALEKELGFARKVLGEQRIEIENLSMISIELERERGRIAGLKTSQKTLRDHCAKMEQSAANGESKISELNSSLGTLQREKDLQGKETDRKISTLESTLTDHNDVIDELKLRLKSERSENSQLRIQLNESEEDVEKVLQQLTSTKLDLENTNKKYEKCVHDLKNSDENLRTIKPDLRDSKLLARKLGNEYKILKEQEKVKDDLAGSMEWRLKQSRKELDYAKEQLRLSDERHQIEIENLKTACQVSKGEAAYLRREVAMARKSKCENQEKFFTSRDEVLATRQETESVKQELFLASQQLRYLKSTILKARDITEIQEFVKNEEEMAFVTVVTTESANQDVVHSNSPLAGLRDCMSLLRNQISSLQEQMNEHTDAVCNTASSWRRFENNVQILQNDCAVLPHKKQLLFPEKDTMKS